MRTLIGYACAALSLILLVGAIWLSGGGSGGGISFVLLSLILLLLAVAFLQSNGVRR